MKFIRIQSVHDKYADELTELYLETFSENQRHNREDFISLLNTNKKFNCNAVIMNNVLVGFFHYWDFDDFLFLEHIAIEPPLRGHKLGEKVINLVRSFAQKPLVIEVEQPESSEYGVRRIEFYRRLGFEVIPHKYLQPPYRKGEEYVPLEMMSDNPTFATDNFEKIRDIIYQNVYKVF
ncbi:MAG: GNAT family N-acetyltransferase [Paludibacteraceae bacterium]